MSDDLPQCPNDCGLLHPHYENTGFTPPDGAPHYEIESWYCPTCGYETSDPEVIDELSGSESEDDEQSN